MLIYVVETAFTLAATLYAMFMGSIAEKSAGASMLFVTFVATFIIRFADTPHTSGVLLALDGIVTVYFIHLVFKYPKPWIRAVVALMAIQCAVHALLLAKLVSPIIYATGNNAVLTLTLILLSLGTWQSRRRGNGGGLITGVGSQA